MRILIANPFGIGDVLFSLPLVRALRGAEPDVFIGFISNRRTEELVDACPLVDFHFTFEKDEFRALWRRSRREGLSFLLNLFHLVQERQFNAFVDLSLGWQYGLGALLAGIPKRVGFNFRHRGRFLTDSIPISGFHDKPVAQYLLDLMPLLGLDRPTDVPYRFTLPEGIAREAEIYLNSLGISKDQPLAALVPGGGASWGPRAPLKHWTPEKFAEVADRLEERYGKTILVVGDGGEAALCGEVARLMKGRSICAIGVPSVLLLGGVLKRCDLVIGNDSGPMQLAACVGTKTVTLFGPVDGSVYGPSEQGQTQVPHRIVSKGLACRPCYQGFRLPPCPWENACLRTLPVGEVNQAVDDLIS